MQLLITGLVVFFGIHLLPSIPSFREPVRDALGARRYRTAFSLVSALGLVLIVFGMIRADYVAVWNPPAWGARAAILIMMPAIILFPAANMPGNIKRFTRHPMMWGVALWGLAHLLANGDLASLLLFGSFASFALFDMVSANLRGATLSATAQPLRKDLIIVAAGLFTYAVLLFLHPWLFGVSPLASW